MVTGTISGCIREHGTIRETREDTTFLAQLPSSDFSACFYSDNHRMWKKNVGSIARYSKERRRPYCAMWCELVLIIKRQYSNFVSQAVECQRSAVNGWVDLPKSLWYPVSYSDWGCPKSTQAAQCFWLDRHMQPAIHKLDKGQSCRF